MMKSRITTEEFIKRSKEVHNKKYDYSNTIYVSARLKLQVCCKIHGTFMVSSDNHIGKKSGCPKCKNQKLSIKFRDTTESFIKKAVKCHTNKYDYSFVKYGDNNREKVVIICKLHGKFSQSPNDHLNEDGCPLCGGTVRLTKDEFIKQSYIIHKNKYDYSQVNYINNRTKVKIKCPIHGWFYQRARGHMEGKGCLKCVTQISKPEIEFLNYIRIPDLIENRQKVIHPFKVDGIKGKKIYEFLGDYYHGNPTRYEHSKFNKKCHKTFGELYDNTIKKFNRLNELGYHIYYMWEKDWYDWNKDKTKVFPIKKFNHNMMYVSDNKGVVC